MASEVGADAAAANDDEDWVFLPPPRRVEMSHDTCTGKADENPSSRNKKRTCALRRHSADPILLFMAGDGELVRVQRRDERLVYSGSSSDYCVLAGR